MNNNIARLGVAAAVVVLAVILGINYLGGPDVGNDPEASPSPSAAAASAAPSPKPLPIVQGTPLSAGTYYLTSYPVQVTVDVPTFEAPAEWFAGCSSNPSVCIKSTPTSIMVVDFLIVDNVVADPCGPAGVLLDPPVGPTVDDLVSAISNLQGFEVTAPIDVTVDGFHGKQFTMTAPDVPDCGGTWATAGLTHGMGPGEASLVRILDVDGVRVVITGTYYSPEASEADLTALQQLMASVHVAP